MTSSEIWVFTSFLPIPASFKALARVLPCELWYEIWFQKSRVPGVTGRW